MRKGILIIIALSLLLISGCVKSANTIPTDNTNKAPSPNTTTNQNTSSGQNTNKPGDIHLETQAPSFFSKSGVTKINYKGTFMFDDIIKKDVTLHLIEVANLKYGKWYELKLDSIDGIPNNDVSLGFSPLSLGYFCAQKDKIYKLTPTETNLKKIKISEEVPKDSVIVCQDQEMKDSLKKDERGWHQYIQVKGNTREYHSYNNRVETGFYESFTWEKDKGLIYFQRGFGAGRDSIDLVLISN